METGRPECGHESDTSLCCVLFARNVLPGPRTAEARSHAGRLTVPQYIRPVSYTHLDVYKRQALIHSVDSQRLLQAIDSQAGKLGLVQDILLEVNIAGEESKGGCTPQEAEELAALAEGMDHVRLRGLMAIPPVSPEPGANRPFFAAMRQLFVDIKGKMAHNQDDMDCLSMGCLLYTSRCV